MQEIRADRRQHIIASAICVLAEYGIVEFTFNKVARQAGISAALIVHYFASKEALLEAAFRSVVRQLNNQATARLRLAAGPRARIQALVDSHLGHNDFSEETARVWLSFWGQALHVPQLARVQRAHQQRMLSNLKFDLRQIVDAQDVSPMADTIAAMIDGVWLRAAMNGGVALQNGLARDLIFDFIARNLKDTLPSHAATSFDTINPATGQVLATIQIDGQAEVNKAVARAAEAQVLRALAELDRGRLERGVGCAAVREPDRVHRRRQVQQAQGRVQDPAQTRPIGCGDIAQRAEIEGCRVRGQPAFLMRPLELGYVRETPIARRCESRRREVRAYEGGKRRPGVMQITAARGCAGLKLVTQLREIVRADQPFERGIRERECAAEIGTMIRVVDAHAAGGRLRCAQRRGEIGLPSAQISHRRPRWRWRRRGAPLRPVSQAAADPRPTR